MTRPDFFPDLAFGWTFYAVLVSLLIAATIFDFRTFTIPKKISVSCFVLGILFNLSRGLWLGLQSKDVWYLSSWFGPGPVTGILDGFLFSAAGAGFSFVLFLGLWQLKVVRGGDVKLYVAVGAWVGVWYFLYLLVASVVVHVIVAMLFMPYVMLTQGFGQARKQFSAAEVKYNKGQDKGKANRKPKHRGMTQSFPLMVATAVVLLVVFSIDLGLRPAPESPNQAQDRSQDQGLATIRER